MTTTFLVSLFIFALLVIAIGALQATVMRRRDQREHRFAGHSPENTEQTNTDTERKVG